jgi:hypothetical protein
MKQQHANVFADEREHRHPTRERQERDRRQRAEPLAHPLRKAMARLKRSVQERESRSEIQRFVRSWA